MKKALIIILSLYAFCANAITIGQVRFHDEVSDTTKITELLIATAKQDFDNPNSRIEYIARCFLGKPYVAHTLENGTEMLTVNIDEVDCTTFVETVIALAYTVGEGRSSWRDFIHNLEKIRYRNGRLDGYSSRLHYISDWIIDNNHRGNIKEVSNTFPYHSYQIKSLDFMSRNRKKYAALKDSTEFERIKNTEIGYRNHRFPYIKKENLRKKEVQAAFKEGDIVALTTNIEGLDVSHLGIITLINNTPHLLHASSAKGDVTIESKPLHETLSKNRYNTGVRVIRLNQ